MDINKYNHFVEKMLSLNLIIDNSFFKFTKFLDEEVENKFQKEREQKDLYQKILSDIILICGYIASMFYIIFAFYKFSFLLICLSCSAISSILIIISYFIKNKKVIYIISNLEIFLIALSLNLKGNLLSFYYYTPQDDNYSELLRIIIYDFVSGNLFVLLKLEANFFVNIFYFMLNIFLIISASIYSNSNHFYFLEGFTSFLFTFICFFLRKAWDFRVRKIFAEKYKFERLYKYTIDFIIGLNAYHVNIKNDEFVYSDEKMSDLVEEFANKCDEFKKNVDFENEKNKNEKKNQLITENVILDSKNNLLVELNCNPNMYKIKNNLIRTNKNEELICSEDNDNNNKNLKFFFKNLFLFVDQNDIDLSKTLNKKSALKKKSKKADLANNKNLNGSKNKGIFFHNEQVKKESLFSHLNKIKKDEFQNLAKENCNENENKNGKNFNSNLISDFDFTVSAKKIKNNFVHLGIYHFNNPEIKKFFDVFYRGISIDDSNIVYDILFYDISELIISKKIIYEENIIKQKVLAKIAHEFKTPINSIIGLINNLKENLNEGLILKDQTKIKENQIDFCKKDKNNNSKQIKDLFNNSKIMAKNIKTLNIIQNLSQYIIFLVSDIIQFSTIKDINQINIHNKRINMREIANFSFDILNCLLKCNLSKYQKTKTYFRYEEEIDRIIIKIDEIRLKQIILNLISNAVKFTKCGHIIITFKIEENNNFIKVEVSDTGIGVKESDKEKLFNDYVMLGDGINLNSLGSGLGLSICKILAHKMNLRLNFESKYGLGSKFYINIPIKNDLNKTSINLLTSLENFKNKTEFYKNSILRNTIELGSLSSLSLVKNDPFRFEKFLERNIKPKTFNDNFQKSLHNKISKVTSIKENFPDNAIKSVNNDSINIKELGILLNKTKYNIEIIDFEDDCNLSISINRYDNCHKKQIDLDSEFSTLIDFDKINRFNVEDSINSEISIANVTNNLEDNLNFVIENYEDIRLISLLTDSKNLESKKSSFDSRIDISNQMNYNYNNNMIQYNINNTTHDQNILLEGKKQKNDLLIISNFEKMHEKIIINNNDLLNGLPSTNYSKRHSIDINSENNELSQHNKIKRYPKNIYKIMIVEDNHFINDSLKRLLEKVIKESGKDFEIIQIPDGIDMIKQIIDDQSNGNLIKCILTDENMEYINGSEAIRILRGLEKRNKIKHVKIISISCQEDNYTVKMILDSGADLVLGKPISRNLIFNSLIDLKIF